MSRRSVAIHEAGHAVATIALGGSLDAIHMCETQGAWAGHCVIATMNDLDQMTMLAAGDIAKFKDGSKLDRQVEWGSRDFNAIDEIAERHPEALPLIHRRNAEKRAFALLSDPKNWRAVIALANALMEREEVPGDEVETISREITVSELR